MLQARTRQKEAVEAVVSNYLAGVHQQLIVMATGTGKTVVMALIVDSLRTLLPGKVLVFAHREELVDQAIATIQEWNPSLKIGKEMASFCADTDCDVVVSCVASIGREGTKRLQRFGEFSAVFCDEAHHSIAQTYLNVFDQTGVLKPDTQKLLVGFTATPKRKNRVRDKGKDKWTETLNHDEALVQLSSVYKKIVYSYTIRQAIKEGWLVPLIGYRQRTTTDLSNVKTTGGDYQLDQLSEAVNTPERNAQIVKLWKENGDDRQTVVFTVDIKHAQDLADAFTQQGVSAAAVWGDDPERKDKLTRHKEGDLKVLCNCGVLTEGYDDWRVSCIVLARPSQSSSLYTQMIGRGTRLQKGIGNLLEATAAGIFVEKKNCIVLDIVDNSKRCSLVTFPSLIGLNPDFELHGESVIEVADKVDALQESHRGINFANLTDLNKVQAYVESINLFEDPYDDEVQEYSKLKWMGTQDGDYVLDIPEKQGLNYWEFKHEKLYIKQNALEQYELSLESTKDNRVLGTYSSLKEALQHGDEAMSRCRPDRLNLVQREAKWHNKAATTAAKSYLKKLSKNKPVPWCLCEEIGPEGKFCSTCGKLQGVSAGQVANAINLLKARKGTWVTYPK